MADENEPKRDHTGAIVFGGVVLAAGGLTALILLNRGLGQPAGCNPACTPPETCVNGICVAQGTCNCTAPSGACLCAMPVGSLVQDPSTTISIISAPCQRQGFTDLSLVQGCGYDLSRLVQISGDRREAIPLGAVISTPGICPPQSSEESPPSGANLSAAASFVPSTLHAGALAGGARLGPGSGTPVMLESASGIL